MTALTQAEQLALILALQRDLALEGNVDNVLPRITGTATALLAAERATVYVIDNEHREVWSRAAVRRPRRTPRRRSACRSMDGARRRGGAGWRRDGER